MAFQISRAIDAHQIGYAVSGACALFVVLLLLFELLRTRLYWIYEPRVHRDDYKSKTPPAPGRTPFAWVRCVFEHWSAFFVVVLLTIVLIPACVAYLYFCRNRNAKLEQRRVDPQTQLRRNPSREELVVGGAAPPPRRGQRRQIHVLKLWLYALALVLFFGGWLAWKNDLNGTWCFKRDSPLYWLQGHAVWHVLTMGALACIYWFFRSERLVD